MSHEACILESLRYTPSVYLVLEVHKLLMIQPEKAPAAAGLFNTDTKQVLAAQ
jgi:hypothetical protein